MRTNGEWQSPLFFSLESRESPSFPIPRQPCQNRPVARIRVCGIFPTEGDLRCSIVWCRYAQKGKWLKWRCSLARHWVKWDGALPNRSRLPRLPQKGKSRQVAQAIEPHGDFGHCQKGDMDNAFAEQANGKSNPFARWAGIGKEPSNQR